MLSEARSILVLAPHTDDAELGCGATLARALELGANVHVAAFSAAEESLPEGHHPDTLVNEFHAAMQAMGIDESHRKVFRYPVRRLNEHRQEVLEHLVQMRRELDPDLVLLPSPNDLHQDHQIVAQEGLRAFKLVTMLGYELPWNHIQFAAQAFSVVEERHVEAKWNALTHYESQIRLERPYFTRQYVYSQARMRGVQIKGEYAESFEVLRLRF